MQNFFN